MCRSEEDGPWILCAYHLATSFIYYNQLGFIYISLFPPVLFVEILRYHASSTVTTLGDWDSLLVVIVVGCTIIIASGLFFALTVNE